MTTTTLADPVTVQSAETVPSMIQVQNLTKNYGKLRAVRDVSFEVGRGEILGFLGPNGAGKSTTMRVLACYTPATSGHVRIAGYDVSTQSIEVRRRLGYLPENAPLYLNMSVAGYLGFMAAIKEVPRASRKGAIDLAIEECGLTEVERRPIANLSKGYRQRVGLAQAVLGDPDVLILDEPTVGLDPKQIAEIRSLIRSMSGRRTVLLSTHILPEVSMICQKVVVINRGKIVATGTPQRLMTESGGEDPPIHVRLKGTGEQARERLEKIEGVKSVARLDASSGSETVFAVQPEPGVDPRSSLVRALVDEGHEVLEMTTPGVTLEDVFLRVISRSESAEAS